MRISNKSSLTLAAAVVSLCSMQAAWAHTGIVETPTVEGGSVEAAFNIPHGCDGTAVRAQSAVFPLGADVVAVDQNNAPVVLADHFDGTNALGLNLGPASIQDKNVFKTQSETLDANGALRGFRYDFGYLDPTLNARVPFRITRPTFKAASCANKLVLQVAVANFCSKSQTDANRADIWVGIPTALFNDNNGEVLSDGYWPTYTINRTSALPAGCTTPVTVTVRPSAAAIDQFLPIPGYWPTP